MLWNIKGEGIDTKVEADDRFAALYELPEFNASPASFCITRTSRKRWEVILSNGNKVYKICLIKK